MCRTLQVASTLSSTFYSMFFLFSGFLQPKSAIPPWWIWCAQQGQNLVATHVSRTHV